MLALGLAVAFPERLHAACARRLARPGLAGWRRAIVAGIDDTVAALATIGRSRSASHAAAHAACVAFIGCYVVIGWLCADGVGLVVGARGAVSSFSPGLMVAYLAPTPGGAGAAEGATAYLLAPSMPAAAAAVALVLRTLCMYAIAPVGLALVLREAHRMGWGAFRRGLRRRGGAAGTDDRVDG
ncbi:MAG TPA: lysylphosphatidylglycerol synthase domain-containing protein [Kofleriaceae bacterium]|nr:lysylphosphatidylglycerol synthase domain-containing protein [Kofleriaceae bacterium]